MVSRLCAKVGAWCGPLLQHHDCAEVAMPDSLPRDPHQPAPDSAASAPMYRANPTGEQTGDALLAPLPLGVALIGPDLRYRMINPTLAALNGAPPEAHIGRSIAEMIPNLASVLEPLLQQVLATGEPVVNVPMQRPGHTAPQPAGTWLASFYPLRDPEGDVTAVEVVISDVTQLVQSEATLRQQAALLEHAHVLIRDRDSRIISWPQGVQQLYGWTQDEALGRVSYDLLQTRFPISLEEAQARLFAEGRWEGTLIQRRRDGSELIVASHQELFCDAGGEPTHILEVNNDITALVQATDTLRERELQLQLALEVAGLGFWWLDPVDDVVTLDARARAHLGVVQEQLSLTHFLACIHSNELEQLSASVNAALDSRGTGVYRGEHQVLHPDGERRWVDVQMRVVFAGEGPARRPVTVLGTCQDMTERKMAEVALRVASTQAERSARDAREEAARLASLLAHAPIGITLMDAELRYRHINHHLAAVNGLSPHEHLGRTLREVLPLLAPSLEPVYRQVMVTGEPLLDLEVVGETPGDPGVEHIWRVSHFPVQVSDVAVGAGTVVIDITEQRRTEEALRASQQNLASLIENTDGVIWSVDTAYRLIIANQRFYELAQRMAGQLPAPGESMLPDSMPQEIREELRGYYARAFAGEVFSVELPYDMGVEPQIFEYRFNPIRSAAGEITGATVFARDITQRRRDTAALAAQAETLSRTNAELTRALRLKDEFLAMMSHELRTPLTAVLGLAEAMAQEVYGPISVEQRRSLEQISASGRHLLAILSDVLDLARIEAGGERLELVVLDVDSLCRSAMQFVGGKARQKQIRLMLARSYDVEAVRADERRLTQILINLLDNAVKFTPVGGTVGLEVVGDVAQERLTLTVWDTGIGIAAADMDRLFQPFTQVDGSLSRSYEGVGLGLSLVRRLTDLHGGSVHVESTPDAGSRFSITLPWSEQDNVVYPAPAPAPAPAPMMVSWPQPPRVLVVDDHEVSLELFAALLTQAGCTVLTARNGTEALEQIRTWRPNIVLLDIQMPGLDGLEVIQRVRADASVATTPIIAVTALAMAGDRERVLAAGATRYLTKPVGMRSLIVHIAEVLATYSADASLEEEADGP
ncbi:PAS domain S-box protein [Scytonema tolypothrichoides VB-61278]|nr:PAS domain S-box protein [Scytonema tolypothrichoides VB-61278]